MVKKTLSVSITEEQDKILELYNLSASALLQESIEEVKKNQTISAETVKEVTRQRDKWRDNFNKLNDFLKSKGLFDEYYGILE